MNLIFTLLFMISLVGGALYGGFLLFRKMFKKAKKIVSPYLEIFSLSKQQKEVLNLAKESINSNSVQVAEKEEDLQNVGTYKNVMLVFKNRQFSIGYEYRKTKDFLSLDDVNVIMYLSDSDKYVDANSLKSTSLMMLVEDFLKKSKEVEKENEDQFLFDKMRSRNTERKYENNE